MNYLREVITIFLVPGIRAGGRDVLVTLDGLNKLLDNAEI